MAKIKKKKMYGAGGFGALDAMSMLGGTDFLSGAAGQYLPIPGMMELNAAKTFAQSLGMVGSALQAGKPTLTTSEGSHTRASAYAKGGAIRKRVLGRYEEGGMIRKRVLGRYGDGGVVKNLGGGAKEFVGNTHEYGGIDIGGGIEVEGGETMDNLQLKGNKVLDKGGIPYVFSNRLKLPGKNITFANAHKNILKSGNKEDILELARTQEKINGGTSKDGRLQGGGNPQQEMMKKMEAFLPYAPTVLDTVTGLMRGQQKVEPTQVDRRAESTIRNTPINFDINPALNENRRQTLAVQRSPGATTNTRLAAHANNLNATESLRTQKSNIENERSFNRDRTLASIQAGNDAQQAQFNEVARQQQFQQPGRLDFLSAGLTGLGQVRKSQIENADIKDKDQMGLMATLSSADPASLDVMLSMPGMAEKTAKHLGIPVEGIPEWLKQFKLKKKKEGITSTPNYNTAPW